MNELLSRIEKLKEASDELQSYLNEKNKDVGMCYAIITYKFISELLLLFKTELKNEVSKN